MKKIIFIAGFTGGKRDFIFAKMFFKKYSFIYFKYNTLLVENIEKIARDLKKFIDSLNLEKNEKVYLIGMSAGGVIAEYYAKFLDSKKKIKKIYTIHSPLKGSYCLSPIKLKGAQQLSAKSDFIKKLNKNKTKVNQLNFWNYFDYIVPGKSAKGKNPKNSFMPIHSIIQWWPPIYFSIKKDLEKIT